MQMESAMVDLEVQASKNIERCSFSFAKKGIDECYNSRYCNNIKCLPIIDKIHLVKELKK